MTSHLYNRGAEPLTMRPLLTEQGLDVLNGSFPKGRVL
jgi:hypothetical protein